jgi:DNA/RNA-binding domain of Phe-tRNA-synthetase-like protein
VYFCHSSEIWAEFPELVPGVVTATGITTSVSVDAPIAELTEVAKQRLAASSEGELPEIQAWRRAFSRMGLKPTQYRCASEALLRRLRKEGSLPRIHPLVDLCNAISAAFAVPVAVLDLDRIAEGIEVRYANGTESYLAFSGETEHPEPGEVVFADAAGRAHARRWTNRQSAYSAVGNGTTAVLVVAEAMHESAHTDVETLTAAISTEIGNAWSVVPEARILSKASPRFEFSAVVSSDSG